MKENARKQPPLTFSVLAPIRTIEPTAMTFYPGRNPIPGTLDGEDAPCITLIMNNIYLDPAYRPPNAPETLRLEFSMASKTGDPPLKTGDWLLLQFTYCKNGGNYIPSHIQKVQADNVRHIDFRHRP